MNALTIHKISNCFYMKKLKFLSKIIDKINYIFFNSYIPGSCEIGKETKIAYGGIGVVLHARSKVGKHCMIGQGMTLGGKNGEEGVPIIENNCYLGAGCRIIGNVVVGHDSIIGPNSVITKSIEPYSVVVGIPGKVINTITKYNIEKYKRNYGPLNYKE